MKLYGSLTSPYVRKLRVLIEEKRLACEFVVAEPRDPDGPIQARHPLALAPVFERDDGSVLFDSPVIAEYLDSLAAPALIPSGESRWSALRWAALADGILDIAVARTMELRRPPAQQSAEVQLNREQKIARAFSYAEKNLAGAIFLVDNRLTLADIALAVALDYIDFRYSHDWRSTHPKLTRWHAQMSARPSFVQTHPPAPKQ
jgi:glutathione S-transferase